MTAQITPSKTVGSFIATLSSSRRSNTNSILQAASAIEDLKMGDSPAKKLNFEAAGKENLPFDADAPVVADIELKKPIVEEVKTALVAPTARRGGRATSTRESSTLCPLPDQVS